MKFKALCLTRIEEIAGEGDPEDVEVDQTAATGRYLYSSLSETRQAENLVVASVQIFSLDESH